MSLEIAPHRIPTQSATAPLTLEHRQIPCASALVEAQDIKSTVIAFDLHIAIVESVPLIERFDNIDTGAVQTKSSRDRHAVMICGALDLDTHSHLSTVHRCNVRASYHQRAPGRAICPTDRRRMAR